MTTAREQPGFRIDAAGEHAYRVDLEAELGPIAAYQRSIDLGAGTGIFSEFLASTGTAVIGIDRDQSAIEQARLRVPQGRFVVDNIEDPALPQRWSALDERFDLVAARYAIHELSDPITTFGVWKQLLRPEGRLVLIENCWQRRDWGWSDWGHRSDQLPLACTQTWATAAYCLRTAGLQIVRCTWMNSVNRLEDLRIVTGFRLYMIVARLPAPG